MTGKLNGRVALVTGAASGIGRSSALAFAEDGARVVVADILADQGRETVDLIESAGGEAIYVPADVSRRSDVERLVRTAIDTFGRLDCAHNNAASKATPQRGQNSTTIPTNSGTSYWASISRACGCACRRKLPRCSLRVVERSSIRPPSRAWLAVLVGPTAPPSMAWSDLPE